MFQILPLYYFAEDSFVFRREKSVGSLITYSFSYSIIFLFLLRGVYFFGRSVSVSSFSMLIFLQQLSSTKDESSCLFPNMEILVVLACVMLIFLASRSLEGNVTITPCFVRPLVSVAADEFFASASVTFIIFIKVTIPNNRYLIILVLASLQE